VARSPITLAAITCAHCGARVREDRAHCLRCGHALVAAEVHHEQHSARLTTILGVAGGLAAAGLIGMVVMRPGAPRRPAEAAPVAAAPQVVRAVAPVAITPPPAATAFDATQHGRAAYATGDLAGSIAEFEKAAQAQPDNAVALNGLGQVLVKAGRTTEAIPYFDRAIAASPDTWAYHFNRARAYATLEKWGEAVAGYREAQRLFPDDYATEFNLAKALEARGDLNGAIKEYERAIELAPGEASFHLSHGQALEAAKRPRDAAAAYRRYLELAKTGADADKVKGRIAALEGASAAPR
jgi:tetratricopeptide (TPR) repeat protein